ncbi:TIGR03086 family metal-binding protein [Streptacidiphilus anmyonensis]|uniref:TIGR03086 family metal-binding protein n=1 Tax=Streptacidiphilus anmyonensis TaxID=405782 RepID=UPI0005A93509|nr:TIGR03086 family metal-binding protein [Streptacidiphilus anmyonensis]
MVTRGHIATALPRMHSAALEHIGRLVRGVEPDQWTLPTPCREWTVRGLVNHVTVQEQWLALLLAGDSAAAVGDRLDGDQLGDDPVLAFKRAAGDADEAVSASGALDGTVELWSGPAPARHLVSQLAMDLVVHAWDLARATGADEHLPPQLVSFALRELSGYADRLAATGLFDRPLPVPEGADSQTRLLALTGRQADRPGGAPRSEAAR